MSAGQVLKIARAELGVREQPAGSNQVKYNSWYYGKEVSGSAYPWCMVFVQWVFAQAGEPIGYKTASCTLLMNWAKQQGRWLTSDYRPGDVLIFDFGGDGQPDHTGILEEIRKDVLICIEGNTSTSSDDNGGAVMRRMRAPGQVLGAYRPAYQDGAENKPAPWAAEAVRWALETGLMQGDGSGNLMLQEAMTREQMCVFLYRFARLTGALGQKPPADSK